MLASASNKRPTTVDELIPPQLAAALDRMDFSTRKIFSGKMQGERRSKARGRSVEFEDFRPYVAGDDLRHIDWNVFARLDRLFIKVFQEEQDLALHLVLDASMSMDAGNPNKLLFAQRVAMALGYVGLVNNNRVAMWIFGGNPAERPGAADAQAGFGSTKGLIRRLPPMRGRTGVQKLAKFLLEQTYTPPERVSTREPLSFTQALRTIAATRSGSGGKGVMVVLTDALVPEGYQAGLSLLAGGSATSGSAGTGGKAEGNRAAVQEAAASAAGGLERGDPNAGSGAESGAEPGAGSGGRVSGGGMGVMGGSGAGWDMTLIQVLSPGEIDPTTELDTSGRGAVLGDMRLTDCETGRAAEVTVSAELVQRYLAKLKAYQAELGRFARSRGIQHVLARSDADVGLLLLDDLRRRGVVR